MIRRLLRTRRFPQLPAGVVYALRRDWPDGVHDFVHPSDSLNVAAAGWNLEHSHWRFTPCRPRLVVVPISTHDFWLHAHHRPQCRAPDCPKPELPPLRLSG